MQVIAPRPRAAIEKLDERQGLRVRGADGRARGAAAETRFQRRVGRRRPRPDRRGHVADGNAPPLAPLREPLVKPRRRAIARAGTDQRVGELVREHRPRGARRDGLRLHRHADLAVVEAGDPVGNGHQREIGPARVQDHQLRRGDPPPEERRLSRVGGLQVLARLAQQLLADAGVREDREVLEGEGPLAPRDRELVARPRQAAQEGGVRAAEADVLAPGEHGVVQAVQTEVRVAEDAVDLGRRPVHALLRQAKVESRVLVVVRAHVAERQLGQNQAVLLVERVGLGQKLGGAVDGALLEIRGAEPLELARDTRGLLGSRRGFGRPVVERGDGPVARGTGGRDRGRGPLRRKKERRPDERRVDRCEAQGTRKGVVAWRAGPPTPSWRKTRNP